MELIARTVSVEKPKVTGGNDIVVKINDDGFFVGGQTPKEITVQVTIDFIGSGNCQALVDNPELILHAIFEQCGTVVFKSSTNQNT